MALLLTGCPEPGVAEQESTNRNVPVTLLFENDGCKMYRFRDAGEWRYYARCGSAGAVLETIREYCGKNCTKVPQHSVPSIETDK